MDLGFSSSLVTSSAGDHSLNDISSLPNLHRTLWYATLRVSKSYSSLDDSLQKCECSVFMLVWLCVLVRTCVCVCDACVHTSECVLCLRLRVCVSAWMCVCLCVWVGMFVCVILIINNVFFFL